ncbi:MAG: 4'-phosphopantetheinyl transferase superfamily protein [Lachnospiraceae bacterium]|nr:4'-phosphopantetheinyl transferase superfamily protein [Lachnospiraceae bacterium]
MKPDMDAKIFVLPMISFEWTAVDESLLQYLSHERQKKVNRFYFQSDKRLSLYAALLTRMELSLALNQPPVSLVFDTDKNQKPCLRDTDHLYFNLSHTKGLILLGIASSPIGVDVEGNQKPAFDIMTNYFHEDEVRYITDVSSEKEKSERFFHVWTKKEALTKYLGSGLHNHLKKINTQDISLQPDFTTWSYESFICSVYSKTPLKEKPTIVAEADVVNFFRTL